MTTPTLLIIDDEQFAMEHLARILGKKGITVHTAVTGGEGIRKYSEVKPDLVFLDVLLPDVDGEYVFRYIREADPEARIYFITGMSSVFSGKNAQEMGAEGFLAKPIEVDEILRVIAACGERG
jgi:DNA-binding response OmpR family regulator